jgi:hypothetical protein
MGVTLAATCLGGPGPDAGPYAGHVKPRITVIGKPGCHLCEEAVAVVSRVSDDTGAGWQELSVLDSPGLADKYSEYIPVILVDGEQHDFFRVDEQRLREALAGRKRWFTRS